MTPPAKSLHEGIPGRIAIARFLTHVGVGGPITQSAIAAFIVKILAAPSTFLFQFGLVRLIRPEAYGEFIYAYAWYATLVPIAALGLHEASVRFVAEHHARREYTRLKGFLLWAVFLATGGALGVAVVASAATLLLRDRLTTTLLVTLLIGWSCIPMGGLTQLASATLRALDRFARAQTPHQVLQPLLIVGTTFALVKAGGMEANAVAAAWAMLASVIAVLGISGLFAIREVSRVLPAKLAPRYEPRVWADAAVHFVGLLIVLLLWRVDVLMLGAMASTTEAGVYATVAQVQLVVGSAFYTLEIVLAPAMASLYGSGEREKLQRILRMASRLTAGVAALGVIVLLLIGRWILSLFDPSFVAGYMALMILAGSQLYDAISGSSGRLLTMTGHHRAAMWLMTAAIVLNVGLNFSLIPIFGMAGAAIATASAVVIWKTLSTLYARRVLGIDTSVAGGWQLKQPLEPMPPRD